MTNRKPKNRKFIDALLKGNIFKDIVKLLLEKSGYAVYPYGYESTFSTIKASLTKGTKNSRTVRRIRSSPDLLVFDEQRRGSHRFQEQGPRKNKDSIRDISRFSHFTAPVSNGLTWAAIHLI